MHKRAVDWAHAKGIVASLHSCGDVNPFVPELVEIGMDGLNPLEVKAGMDPVQVKREYGDRLLLHGGIHAVPYDDREAIEAEMRRAVPLFKEHRALFSPPTTRCRTASGHLVGNRCRSRLQRDDSVRISKAVTLAV